MKPQKRMIKMLACLVGSMCGAAALLAWIEPGAGRAFLDPAQMAEFVHQVVASDDASPLRTWQNIVIDHQPGDASGRARLAATWERPSTDHHFRIDADGALLSSPAWQRQDDCPMPDGRAGTIRIVLTCPADAGRVPAAQWLTLRALLTELNRDCATAGAQLPVTIRGSVSSPSPSPSVANHLRELMGGAQLLRISR
jgi:hypothetical protein